jgi:hypothetical protein
MTDIKRLENKSYSCDKNYQCIPDISGQYKYIEECKSSCDYKEYLNLGSKLIQSVSSNNISAIEDIIKEGASPDFIDDNYNTPLLIAIEDANYEAFINLLNNKANIYYSSNKEVKEEAKKENQSPLIILIEILLNDKKEYDETEIINLKKIYNYCLEKRFNFLKHNKNKFIELIKESPTPILTKKQIITDILLNGNTDPTLIDFDLLNIDLGSGKLTMDNIINKDTQKFLAFIMANDIQKTIDFLSNKRYLLDIISPSLDEIRNQTSNILNCMIKTTYSHILGPVELSELYNEKLKKHIYLFGDIHTPQNNCDYPRSINISDFLEKIILDNKNKIIDIFLEFATLTKKLEQEDTKQLEALKKSLENTETNQGFLFDDVKEKWKKCLTIDKEKCKKKYPNLRMHTVDVTQINKKYWNLVQFQISETKRKNIIKHYKDIIYPIYINISDADKKETIESFGDHIKDRFKQFTSLDSIINNDKIKDDLLSYLGLTQDSYKISDATHDLDRFFNQTLPSDYLDMVKKLFDDLTNIDAFEESLKINRQLLKINNIEIRNKIRKFFDKTFYNKVLTYAEQFNKDHLILKNVFDYKAIRKELNNFIKEPRNRTIENIKEYVSSLHVNRLKALYTIKFFEYFEKINEDIFSLLRAIMDIYLIARMFSTFEEEDTPTYSVIYAGAWHTDNYKLLLLNDLGFGTINYTSSSVTKKCLNISNFTQPFFSETRINIPRKIDLTKNIIVQGTDDNKIILIDTYKRFINVQYTKSTNILTIEFTNKLSNRKCNFTVIANKITDNKCTDIENLNDKIILLYSINTLLSYATPDNAKKIKKEIINTLFWTKLNKEKNLTYI